MNRGFGFILSVPILFIAILLMLLVHNVQQEQMQLEEYVLKFAIDYSTDAAVEEMLSMSHLGQFPQDLIKFPVCFLSIFPCTFLDHQ